MASSQANFRVLKVVPTVFSPPKKSSGMKSYALTLRRYLEERGVKVDLLGAALDGGPEKNFFLARIPIKSDVLFSFYVIPKYLKLRNKYDLIHISDPFLTLPLLLYFTRRPSVLTLHDVWSDAVKYKKGWFAGIVASVVEYFSVKLASRLIAVDDKIKDAYAGKYPWAYGKIDVVRVGVDLDLFKPMDDKVRERFGFAVHDKIILYLGRFEKEKNLGFLLHAFKRVKASEPRAKLVLIGDGRERKKLEAMKGELGLDGVSFMGALEQESVPLALNCANVFALTSKYESCPLVAYEALACGVPLVSVDVGRVSEIVSNGVSGRVVSRDAAEMADALTYFINKGRNAKTKTACRKETYSAGFRKTAEKTLAVYRKTLGGFTG